MSECKVNPFSSRICEKGTKGCNVKHNSMSNLREKIDLALLKTAVSAMIARCKEYDKGNIVLGDLIKLKNTLENMEIYLPELQQTIEDAEKWRKTNKEFPTTKDQMRAQLTWFLEDCDRASAIIEKASQFDRLFEELVVTVTCEYCNGIGRAHDTNCSLCNGIGVISRPLTEEEKMFLVSQIVGEIQGGRDIMLPSGKKVVRKK